MKPDLGATPGPERAKSCSPASLGASHQIVTCAKGLPATTLDPYTHTHTHTSKSHKERRWQNPGLSLLRSVLMAHMGLYVNVTQQVTSQQPRKAGSLPTSSTHRPWHSLAIRCVTQVSSSSDQHAAAIGDGKEHHLVCEQSGPTGQSPITESCSCSGAPGPGRAVREQRSLP